MYIDLFWLKLFEAHLRKFTVVFLSMRDTFDIDMLVGRGQ